MGKLTKQINDKEVCMWMCVREQVEGVQRYNAAATVSSLYSPTSLQRAKESSFSASCLFAALTESTEGKSFPPSWSSSQKTPEYSKPDMTDHLIEQ